MNEPTVKEKLKQQFEELIDKTHGHADRLFEFFYTEIEAREKRIEDQAGLISLYHKEGYAHLRGHGGLSHVLATLTDGLYPIEGLEFEVIDKVECQKEHRSLCSSNNNCGCPSRKIAIVSLSSTPDTVEPTAKEGEQPWELQIIKNIWRRAYLDSEEDHVKILKEYGEKIASQERSKAIQEALNLPKIKIAENNWDGVKFRPTNEEYIAVKDLEKLNQK